MTSHKTDLECSVHKSLKKDETYLFIPTTTELSDLPPELLKILGQTEKVMDLTLTPEKKMARGSAESILNEISEQGFHLQMPEKDKNKVSLLGNQNERFLDKNI